MIDSKVPSKPLGSMAQPEYPFRFPSCSCYHRDFTMKPIRILSALTALAALPLLAQDRTLELLRTLADAPGPPGFEEPVRKIMVDAMKPYVSSIRYDGMGSILATQGTDGPRIMVDAHMDELGGVVRRISPRGFLTMQMLGGWLDQALVDQRWIIIGSKGPVHAVTGIRDAHVVPAEERNRVFQRDRLLFDVGAKNEAEVRAMGVEPGSPVVPDSPFTVLNGTQNYLGKGWDDRVGCAVVIETMRRLGSIRITTRSSTRSPPRKKSACAARIPRAKP